MCSKRIYNLLPAVVQRREGQKGDDGASAVLGRLPDLELKDGPDRLCSPLRGDEQYSTGGGRQASPVAVMAENKITWKISVEKSHPIIQQGGEELLSAVSQMASTPG